MELLLLSTERVTCQTFSQRAVVFFGEGHIQLLLPGSQEMLLVFALQQIRTEAFHSSDSRLQLSCQEAVIPP